MNDKTDNSNDKRVWIFGFALLFLIIAVSVANARVERNYRSSAAQHIILTVDSIDFRSDLTRLYGKLVGRPHTSQKIQSVKINTASGSFTATDIDGVDFKRWFQWEDDGIIPVEIDFAAMTPVQNGTIIIDTAKGVDSCTFSK